ncbi:MAG: hypothetical protein J0M34_01420 [Alphaproteobacteria bacterium]|nr:hypothetical protein [Alphaproteobacteria bacterium]
MLFDLTQLIYRAQNDGDDQSFYFVLNDLYDQHPERFGDASTQEQLKSEIQEAINTRLEDYPFSNYRFVKDLVRIFQAHNVNPLSDTSIAYISPYAYMQDTFGPLINMCASYTETGTCEHLYTHNADQVTGGKKVDYVISGNVINHYHNTTPLDTLIACGMMLKKDGRAIHLIDYGPGVIDESAPDEKDTIALQTSYEKAGQQLLHFYPENMGRYDRLGTRAIVLRQAQELEFAPIGSITQEREIGSTTVSKETNRIE